MIEFDKIGYAQIGVLVLGTILMFVVPLVIAIVWTKKKKERFTTVLVGAATFFLFAMVLEKPLLAVLIAPTQMGLADTGISQFINERPVLNLSTFYGYPICRPVSGLSNRIDYLYIRKEVNWCYAFC